MESSSRARVCFIWISSGVRIEMVDMCILIERTKWIMAWGVRGDT